MHYLQSFKRSQNEIVLLLDVTLKLQPCPIDKTKKGHKMIRSI